MRRRSVDSPFLITLAGLLVFGLLMLLSASSPSGYQKFSDTWYFFKHQLLYGVLPGTVLFFLLSRIDYRRLKPLAGAGLLVSILLLVMVFLPGLGLKFGGSERWVKLGPIAFQPSEFVKITFIFYLAAWFAAREKLAKTLEAGLLPFILALAMIAGLLILQPNTGSMAVIAGAAVLMYFIAGAPWGWFGVFGLGAGALLWLLIRLTPYRAARFLTFLHPELDPKGIGYHINQAYLAIGSGGLFGVGYGHSRQKYLYLPEASSDSIFAVMAEELGFFVVVAFICALGFLIHRIFHISQNAPDLFGRYLTAGIGSWIAIQSILNVASMVGLMPMTGVTLPFVSYGSSAFLAIAIGMGLVASVSRFTSVP